MVENPTDSEARTAVTVPGSELRGARRRRAVVAARLGPLGRAGLAALLAASGLVAAAQVASTAPSGVSAPAQTCDPTAVHRDRAAVLAVEADAQQDFLARLNGLRRSRGLRTLVWNEAITGPAIGWSETMSVQIPPGGSAADPGWLHHARDTGPDDGVAPDQDYVTINSRLVPNWSRLAENVGVGGMRTSCSRSDLDANTDKVVLALHDAFVASPGHLKNMVGDHNQVGIGVHIDHDELWVTVRFANGDLPSGAQATPVTASTVSYVDAAYRVFARRGASEAEARWWGPRVQSGDRGSLTRALAVSDTWAGVRVNDMYRTILGRDADRGGRAYWLDQIARGLQLESAAVEFFGSREYFVRAGGTEAGFVRALYQDLLGRRADRAGTDYWVGFLRSGRLTRSGVADNFYRSIESRRDRVTRLHTEIMGVSPTASARDRWADRLAQVGDIVLSAELAASQEFWNRAVR